MNNAPKDFLWWKDGIIYQIYPRSFMDANNDGIGDLQGISSRLDYLQDLGIDAVWLSPIYPSPDIDFGYDVSDYLAIDQKFGTMADFDQLLDEAHARGIRVILDLVLNHTSNQHPWFKESRSAKDNPYRNWYIWRDGRSPGKEPNNWESIFGGKGWEFDPVTGQYYYHMFYREQPDLNWRNPDVQQAMLDIFRFWLAKGVDGFRLDVFNVYFKNKDFLDNPSKIGLRGFDRQKHIYDIDQPEMVPLLEEIRKILDGYLERYAVGETFISDQEKDIRYCGEQALHAVFNFEFTNSPWKADRFMRAINAWEELKPHDIHPTYVLNNHDVTRSATRYRAKDDDARLKVAAALLLTTHGTPFLYYGEEIGMRDIHIRRSEILDPIGKKYWPAFKGRDGCRGPMQWDGTEHAGFSQVPPWLPIHPNYPQRNVLAQQENPCSLYNFYRRLLKIRRENPALRSGCFTPVYQEDRNVLVYLRHSENQKILVVLNFSKRNARIEIKHDFTEDKVNVLHSSTRHDGERLPHSQIDLDPYEASLFLIE